MAPLPPRPRLAFFVSHRGSNMRAIAEACLSGRLKADRELLISNNRSSAALAWADEVGLAHLYLSPKMAGSEEALDEQHVEALKAAGIDLVILAGYMRKIGPRVLKAYDKRILNIHPALLPKYGGQGMFGHHVHEAVIAAGETESGVTVHLVDGDYDTGPIVAQATVPVHKGDTPDDLAARVLKREHEFFTETLIRIVSGEIDLDALA